MVKVVEIVLELEASGFINSGKITRGRVVRDTTNGEVTCQVDDRIKGVKVPEESFSHIDHARAALLKYWGECNTALQFEFWLPRPR